MKVIQVPYSKDCADELWPSFKVSLEEKHGERGSQGAHGEANCIKLIESYLPEYKICYDHSQDCIGQYFGIDLTLISKNSMDTVDCKSGKTGLYWDTENKYWYITIRKESFNTRKKNTHFIHVGPKGDVFVMYKKNDLINFINNNKSVIIPGEYGIKVQVNHIKEFAKTNL